MDSPETVEELALRVQQAYAAYSASMGGADAEHRPLAPFASLHVRDQEAWKAAVMAALSAQVPAPAQVPTPAPEAPPLSTPATEEDPTPRRHR